VEAIFLLCGRSSTQLMRDSLGSAAMPVPSTGALSKLPIVAKDGEGLYSYAKVDLLDSGNGLMIYDYYTKEKLSRHSDGKVYKRVVGVGGDASPTTSLPFSQIQHEQVRTVPIPVDATAKLPPFKGNPASAMVFSSTVLSSNGTFAAEIADATQLQRVLRAWQAHPDYVSAQTWQPTGTGKVVILTVLNQRST
jgi:hypothetical protein